mgnify:CR=1 FL=1
MCWSDVFPSCPYGHCGCRFYPPRGCGSCNMQDTQCPTRMNTRRFDPASEEIPWIASFSSIPGQIECTIMRYDVHISHPSPTSATFSPISFTSAHHSLALSPHPFQLGQFPFSGAHATPLPFNHPYSSSQLPSHPPTPSPIPPSYALV